MRFDTDGWSLERELQAQSVELLHALWRVTVMVNSKKGTTAPKPLHLPRPKLERHHRPRRPAKVHEIATRLGGMS